MRHRLHQVVDIAFAGKEQCDRLQGGNAGEDDHDNQGHRHCDQHTGNAPDPAPDHERDEDHKGRERQFAALQLGVGIIAHHLFDQQQAKPVKDGGERFQLQEGKGCRQHPGHQRPHIGNIAEQEGQQTPDENEIQVPGPAPQGIKHTCRQPHEGANREIPADAGGDGEKRCAIGLPVAFARQRLHLAGPGRGLDEHEQHEEEDQRKNAGEIRGGTDNAGSNAHHALEQAGRLHATGLIGDIGNARPGGALPQRAGDGVLIGRQPGNDLARGKENAAQKKREQQDDEGERGNMACPAQAFRQAVAQKGIDRPDRDRDEKGKGQRGGHPARHMQCGKDQNRGDDGHEAHQQMPAFRRFRHQAWTRHARPRTGSVRPHHGPA